MMRESPFSIGAHIVFEKKFLLIRRCSEYLHGNWQMVTGRVEKGEKAYETAYREIVEETGIRPDRFFTADVVEVFYEPLYDSIISVPNFVAFIDSPQEVVLSPTEHDAYRWVSYHEALSILEFGDQRKVLRHVYEEFIVKEPNPRFLIDIKQSALI